jgi:hypothetical protein
MLINFNHGSMQVESNRNLMTNETQFETETQN